MCSTFCCVSIFIHFVLHNPCIQSHNNSNERKEMPVKHDNCHYRPLYDVNLRVSERPNEWVNVLLLFNP